jgi:hypothetical protein
MKAIGCPLTTQVEEGVTSPGTDKQWSAIKKANAAYQKALVRYIEKQTDLRFKHFYQEVKRFKRVILAADAWIGKTNLEADPSAMVIVHLVLRAEAICNFRIEAVEAAREDDGGIDIDMTKLPTLEG